MMRLADARVGDVTRRHTPSPRKQAIHEPQLLDRRARRFEQGARPLGRASKDEVLAPDSPPLQEVFMIEAGVIHEDEKFEPRSPD
jgi:hypothetical protein